jgi:hypothetical protein
LRSAQSGVWQIRNGIVQAASRPAIADDLGRGVLKMGMAAFFLDREGRACKIENIYSS